jgi:hypothetical protein
VRLLGLAEVAVEEPPEVRAVLLGQRLVEPVVLTERLHCGRVVDRTLSEVRRRGIAGDKLRQQEGDQGDADRQEEQRYEAPREEPEEGLGRPLARPPQPDRQSKWLTLNRQRSRRSSRRR